MVNDNPTTDPVSPLGGPGAGVGDTTSKISFEGPLVPTPLVARTRRRYVPKGTPLVENVVSALPVQKFARLDNPGAEPASMT